jgi:hypothetical protein
MVIEVLKVIDVNDVIDANDSTTFLTTKPQSHN